MYVLSVGKHVNHMRSNWNQYLLFVLKLKGKRWKPISYNINILIVKELVQTFNSYGHMKHTYFFSPGKMELKWMKNENDFFNFTWLGIYRVSSHSLIKVYWNINSGDTLFFISFHRAVRLMHSLEATHKSTIINIIRFIF